MCPCKECTSVWDCFSHTAGQLREHCDADKAAEWRGPAAGCRVQRLQNTHALASEVAVLAGHDSRLALRKSSSTDCLCRAAARAKEQKRTKEAAQRRQARLWLAGVAAAMVGYVLVTGQYITLGYGDDEDEDMDEEE